MKLGPLPAYVAQPPAGAGAAKPKAAVVLFGDVFGWSLNNTRLWADRLAAEGGFVAVLPDFFRNDSLANYKKGDFVGFLGNQPPSRVLKDYEGVAAAIKARWPSVKKVGQSGFCWGGLYTALLSAGKAPGVDAAVAFHASLLTPAEIDAVKGPVALFQADPRTDGQMNTTVRFFVVVSFVVVSVLLCGVVMCCLRPPPCRAPLPQRLRLWPCVSAVPTPFNPLPTPPHIHLPPSLNHPINAHSSTTTPPRPSPPSAPPASTPRSQNTTASRTASRSEATPRTPRRAPPRTARSRRRWHS